MKKFVSLLLAALLCFALTSCSAGKDFDIKEYIKGLLGVGEAAVSHDEGYVETLENEEYSYEVYEDHIIICEYVFDSEMLTVVGTEVEMPSEIDHLPVTGIGSLCFYYTSGVTAVTVPEGVTKLYDSAFYHSDDLVTLSLPNSITSMGERCFAWCDQLKEIELPSFIDSIPEYCFNSCTSLESISIPKSVISVEKRAFSYCSSLKEVDIPEGAVSIGDRAFSECASLEYVTVPSSVTEIGADLFAGSPNVTVVTAEDSPMAAYCTENGITFITSKPADGETGE